MFGSLVRWPLTWRWLTSVVTPSHGHVFVEVPQGNINSVSIPVTSSNSFSLPLKPFLHNPGISPLPSISLRLPSKGALSSKTQTRSATLVRHRSLNGVRARRPSHMPLYQLRLPVLDRLNTTVETCVLPPISLSLSFLVPVSAFSGLFQHLVGVPFYRLPKTLGWPYSDAPLNGALTPDPRTTSRVTLVAITLLMPSYTSSKKACAQAP